MYYGKSSPLSNKPKIPQEQASMPVSLLGVPVQVLIAPVSIQFLANCLERKWMLTQLLGPLPPI